MRQVARGGVGGGGPASMLLLVLLLTLAGLLLSFFPIGDGGSVRVDGSGSPVMLVPPPASAARFTIPDSPACASLSATSPFLEALLRDPSAGKGLDAEFLQAVSQHVCPEALCGTKAAWNDPDYPSKHVQDLAFLLERKVTAPVCCSALMSKAAIALIDAPTAVWPPPAKWLDVSPELREHYSLGGRIAKVQDWVHRDRYSGANALKSTWTRATIEANMQMQAQRAMRSPHSTYGESICNKIFDVFTMHNQSIAGKRVLVVGSERPWLESILLYAGAREVTTLEYGKINSEHPQIKTVLPHELMAAYAQGEVEPFDTAVSFSSLEHSGLGRYGDTMYPYSDYVAVARLSCLVKLGGCLMVGVPVENQDRLIYNAHRVYGPYRLPSLLTNWAPKGVYPLGDMWSQSLVVATNERE